MPPDGDQKQTSVSAIGGLFPTSTAYVHLFSRRYFDRMHVGLIAPHGPLFAALLAVNSSLR
jgi:hypothetical protein